MKIMTSFNDATNGPLNEKVRKKSKFQRKMIKRRFMEKKGNKSFFLGDAFG